MSMPKGKMPIRKTAAKAPISKGRVVTPQPKGYPAQQSDAYRNQGTLPNLAGGSNALRPVPVKKKASRKGR